MHFMNPVPLMKLVEIIRGLATSDATYETTRALAERLGKTTVVSRDIPGFIVNRILMPMLNEACFALYEGHRRRSRTSTRRCSSGSTTRWGRSRWRTSSASTPRWPSPRSCTASSATEVPARARCCASTSRRAGSAARPAAASTTTSAAATHPARSSAEAMSPVTTVWCARRRGRDGHHQPSRRAQRAGRRRRSRRWSRGVRARSRPTPACAA